MSHHAGFLSVAVQHGFLDEDAARDVFAISKLAPKRTCSAWAVYLRLMTRIQSDAAWKATERAREKGEVIRDVIVQRLLEDGRARASLTLAASACVGIVVWLSTGVGVLGSIAFMIAQHLVSGVVESSRTPVDGHWATFVVVTSRWLIAVPVVMLVCAMVGVIPLPEKLLSAVALVIATAAVATSLWRYALLRDTQRRQARLADLGRACSDYRRAPTRESMSLILAHVAESARNDTFSRLYALARRKRNAVWAVFQQVDWHEGRLRIQGIECPEAPSEVAAFIRQTMEAHAPAVLDSAWYDSALAGYKSVKGGPDVEKWQRARRDNPDFSQALRQRASLAGAAVTYGRPIVAQRLSHCLVFDPSYYEASPEASSMMEWIEPQSAIAVPVCGYGSQAKAYGVFILLRMGAQAVVPEDLLTLLFVADAIEPASIG